MCIIFFIYKGPNYWGRLNPNWSLCKKGRNQSPVNIEPKALLFDPSLTPLDIRGSAVSFVRFPIIIKREKRMRGAAEKGELACRERRVRGNDRMRSMRSN